MLKAWKHFKKFYLIIIIIIILLSTIYILEINSYIKLFKQDIEAKYPLWVLNFFLSFL